MLLNAELHLLISLTHKKRTNHFRLKVAQKFLLLKNVVAEFVMQIRCRYGNTGTVTRLCIFFSLRQ